MSSDHTKQLAKTLGLLTSISGRILQVSDRKAGVALGAASKALVGSAFASAVMGAIGTFGTASTTTAIATLSGAAKTTASLYWIGGMVGGGVAAGTVVLGAGALGAGVYGSMKVRRAILGHARHAEGISEREQRILHAIHSIASAIRQVLDQEVKVSPREMLLLSKVGITPVLSEIDTALDEGCFKDLKIYNRALLRGHVKNLRTLQKKMEQV